MRKSTIETLEASDLIRFLFLKGASFDGSLLRVLGGEHVRLRNSKKNVESNNTISYYFRDYVVAPDPMHYSRFTSEYSLAVNLVRFKLPRKHLSTAE